MSNNMKIKEFSKLTGLSVRTLQYYDEINLLNPAFINASGHRFYDSNSFSKIFIIISLKNMGMNLNEINQYLNNNNFDIKIFIEEEKQRVEKTIIDLQLRLLRLSRLGEQVKEKQNITPTILSLLSLSTNNTPILQEQIDSLLVNKDKVTDFNLKDWNIFIEDLNFCYQNKLSVKDKRAISCIRYWKESILKKHQFSDDAVKRVEEFYQNNSTNTFGITEATYKYLSELIVAYDIHN